MTLRRLSVLQWVGLLLGGAVWFAAHIAGYGLTEASCDSNGWSISHDPWQAALLGTALVLVAIAGAASLVVLRETRDTTYEEEPPESRIRFFAIAAAAANVIFLMIVVLDALGALFNVACRQA